MWVHQLQLHYDKIVRKEKLGILGIKKVVKQERLSTCLYVHTVATVPADIKQYDTVLF